MSSSLYHRRENWHDGATSKPYSLAKPVMAKKKVAERAVQRKATVEKNSFSALVYNLCKSIPKGKVTTYGEIARSLNRPNASRAVGNALRNNPYAPVVPCHRVVASTRAIGGFFGSKSGTLIDRKIQMLKEEAVVFDDDGKVNLTCIYKFPSA
jgi:methylated-DNA-[protein]-cysteine S-methyltransferase